MFGKHLYDRSPLWLQRLATSYVGAVHFRRKYGRRFHESLARLEENERRPGDRLLEEQASSLHELLRYARENVPHYRNLGCPVSDITQWPILERATVAANPAAFVSERHDPARLLSNETSGTTGTPLTVRFDSDTYQLEMAFRWRHRAWAGVPFLSRGAYVAGHPVVPAGQTLPPFWRFDPAENRLLFSSYHMSPRHLDSYWEALRSFRPDFVHGYPSSLYLLARCAMERGFDPLRPRALLCASESLLEFQREMIEQAFGAKLFNWYGNTELTCNIVECERGKLHYRTDYGYLEVLPGGEMVCTGLNNRAMPLIRYRIGDRVALRAGGCECGRAFPLIERIEGRVEDYVVTPDGRQVGRLDHVFKGVTGVREAQLVQDRAEELRVRIVRGRGYSPGTERRIREQVGERLGPLVRVVFEYVEWIERASTGKFRFVVSHCSSVPVESGTAGDGEDPVAARGGPTS